MRSYAEYRELKNMEVNGHRVEFINEFVDCRDGFAHETTMYLDGDYKNSARCKYLNRTWERYRYQSVMCSAVYDLIDARKDRLMDMFKAEKGYKKMTDKRLEEYKMSNYPNDEVLKLYEAILGQLQ